MIAVYRFLVVTSLIVAPCAALLALTLSGTELTYAASLPLAYVPVAALLGRATWHTGPSLFVLITLPTVFLRYVAFPALAALNQGYVGRSWLPPSEESYNLAVLLMIYELIVVGLLVVYLETRFQQKQPLVSRAASALPMWFVVILALTATLFIASFPEGFELVSVVSPTLLRDDAETPAFATLAAMTFVVSMTVLLLGLMSRLARAQRLANFAPWGVTALGALNVAVYFGTNRIAFMLSALATLLVLRRLLSARSAAPIALVTLLTAFLLVTITQEREYAVYSPSRIANLADTVQGYTGGVYNVAIGIEAARHFPEARNWKVLIYDFLRPTIGFNLLVRDWDVVYSNAYFNFRMWTHVERRSQILPMIAQGHLFFSPLLAPLLSVVFVSLAYLLLSILSRTQSLELQFWISLAVMRLAFFWGQNSMNMMNYISLNLVLPALIMAPYYVMRFALAKRRSPNAASRRLAPKPSGIENGMNS